MKTVFIILCLLSTRAFTQVKDALTPLSVNEPIKIPLSKDKGKTKPKPPTTVILDARPFFEFSMSHLEKSQPIRYQDYNQADEPFRGLLDPDVNVIARKLRALGISPSTEVIVLGAGKKGHGEEGRVAWMLDYVGIKNVRIGNYDRYEGKRVPGSWVNQWAPPIWLPKKLSSTRIRKRELENWMAEKKEFTLVDLRSKQDFEKSKIEDAVWMDWQEFLDSSENPLAALEIKALLARNHLKPPVVFYSKNGLESAYATFVCSKAEINCINYDGGYDDWQNGKN